MTAKRAGEARSCYRCGATIPKGAVYFTYRERALSHHEAMHAGTYYPSRKCCADCKVRKEAEVAAARSAS